MITELNRSVLSAGHVVPSWAKWLRGAVYTVSLVGFDYLIAYLVLDRP